MKVLIVMATKITAPMLRKFAGLDHGFVTSEGRIGVVDRVPASKKEQ
jgi:hypothetical protein